ncbi:sigma 54-interacting transcriptional regulator [Clostridiaceae bacterium M8S5]|nr:sigma 54-interacting transcriptional regulator [Clostridiaceae bacterium M8S5]
MRVNRLVRIIITLLNKGTVTAKYLADRFEVSTRTIYRDIDELVLSGIPIYTNKGHGGGISLVEGHTLKETFSLFLDSDEKQEYAGDKYDFQDEGRLQIDIISKIWENFVEEIYFDKNLLKEEILRSWKRCKSNNVSLSDFDIKNLMRPDEKQKYVLKYLPEYELDEYREFYNIVKNLNMDISIYDKDAKLKYIISYDDKLDDLYPNVGYFVDVSENVLGTNSTCIALMENKPALVVGSEHYKTMFHEYSCAAAPFYDSRNEICGTINASFTHRSVNSDTLKIIYNIARLYEVIILKKINYNKHLDYLRRERRKTDLYTFDDIIGETNTIKELKITAQKIAKANAYILLHGETGVGKRLFAQAIHNSSDRRDKPFISINCSAIPDSLIGSELFGYKSKGFEEASRKSLFEYANGGTVFINEIEKMPISAQARLVDFQLDYQTYDYGSAPINTRVIAASTVDLKEIIKRGGFREDLYYMLSIIELNIPPLRDRLEDIELITREYLKKFSIKNNMEIKEIDIKLYKYFKAYEWPDNITQLLNVIEKLIVLSDDKVIKEDYLPQYIINTKKKYY